MIITEMKPFGEIKPLLTKDDKISIISCNACAKRCGTGGEEGLQRIKEKLVAENYNIIDEFLIAPVCCVDAVKKFNPKGDTIIVLACDAGIEVVKRLFPDRKIISALDTKGLGAFDENGDIFLVKEF